MRLSELVLSHLDELRSIVGLFHFEGTEGEGYSASVTRTFRPRRLILGGLKNERITHTYENGVIVSRRKIQVEGNKS
jgi:hypothetical protein